ncbi:MAG: MarR family winged helix-turn-helix transcriptional regulator [Gammaproteobacteria bacterium]
MDPTTARLAKPGAERVRSAARLLSRLASHVTGLCRESDITLQQYRVLVKLTEQSTRSGDLAALLGASRPIATIMLRGMETRGLVRRVPVSEDGRGVCIVVTEKGTRIVEATDARIESLLKALGTRIGLETIVNLFEELHDPFERASTEIRQRVGLPAAPRAKPPASEPPRGGQAKRKKKRTVA